MRNFSETCRLQETGANLCRRWKDEAEQGTKARLEGEARQSRNAKKAVASGNRSARWGEKRWRSIYLEMRRGSALW